MLTDVICGVWVCYKEAGRIYPAALLTSSAGSCRFLTDQKAAEKVAASSEARGTAQGDRGPLENPQGLDGVDRELQRLRRRKVRAGSFPVSRPTKAHPVSRSNSDPLPQVGIGRPKGSLLSRRLSLPPGAPCVWADAHIGPPSALAVGCLFRIDSRSQPQCRAGVHARRLRFPAPQGLPGEMPAWLRHVPIVTRTPPPAPQPLPKNPLSICATLQFLPSRPFLPSGRLTFSS